MTTETKFKKLVHFERTTETKLKRLVHFDINNKTDVSVLNSCYLLFENQDYFKNGKPKGDSWDDQDYYFFDNKEDYENFMNVHEYLPESLSHITLVIDEGLKYDRDFLIKNLNKK